MSYLSKKAAALAAYRLGFLFLVPALAAIMVLSVPTAQAQDQPPAGALRGYISPPPDEGYPTQPVAPPIQMSPKATDQNVNQSMEAGPEATEQKQSRSRPPATVFPPPESPYDVDMAKMGFRVVSAGVVDRISFVAGAHRKTLEADSGKKLVVATLQGKNTSPIRMPIGIYDFSAFWVEVHVKDLYGKKVSERVVQVVRAAGLETPRGWLIEGEGIPGTALFYFLDPGPVSLRVAFLLPTGVIRFGIRYPLIAVGEAIIVSDPPPAKK